MITILFAKIDVKLPDVVFFHYLDMVPKYIKNRILKFHRWQDRYASLYGKLLLKEGLKKIGRYDLTLEDIKYNEYNRPFLNQGIDFNISHSGVYVVCAISSTTRLGIDIEQVNDIEVEDFKSFFTTEEWLPIFNNGNPLYKTFYFYWTRKEAVLKANGKGLTIPLDNVSVVNDDVLLESEKWKLLQFKLQGEYICHIAFETDPAEVVLKEVLLNNF